MQQKFKKDPYVTTLGGFSKVTNYIFDAFRGTEEQHQRPPEEVADLLGEVIPGLEINQLEEPGFEVITRVREGFCLGSCLVLGLLQSMYTTVERFGATLIFPVIFIAIQVMQAR